MIISVNGGNYFNMYSSRSTQYMQAFVTAFLFLQEWNSARKKRTREENLLLLHD